MSSLQSDPLGRLKFGETGRQVTDDGFGRNDTLIAGDLTPALCALRRRTKTLTQRTRRTQRFAERRPKFFLISAVLRVLCVKVFVQVLVSSSKNRPRLLHPAADFRRLS